MQKQSFLIEFYCVETDAEQRSASSLTGYTALVTVVSLNFQLFKISLIRRSNSNNLVHLSGCYYITSYPSPETNDLKWKDASTFGSDKFIQMMGAAIEEKERQRHTQGIKFSCK